MTTLRRCLDMLERYGVPHVHTNHPNAYRAREVAEAEQLPPYLLAKTVVVSGPVGYAMALVPADCKADLAELARALNFRHLRLATEEEVRRLFPESEVGAVPPFGALFGMPVYMDEQLAEEAYVFFNAGTHRDAIHMSIADFVRIADPVIIRFAYPDWNVSPDKTMHAN